MVDCLVFNNEKEENFKIREKNKSKKKKTKIDNFFNFLKDENNNERIFGMISMFFGFLGLLILLYVYLKYPSEKVIGEGFVKEELQFLYTPYYRFQFKPITLFQIFVLLFCMFGLESQYTNLYKKPELFKRSLFIFFCLVALIYTFENIQNFFNWYSFFIINVGKIPIDELIYQLKPGMPSPINYTFLGKINNLFWSCALYGIYFTHRLLKKEKNK
jgi:magnesium-transporting ATPase (P-type)